MKHKSLISFITLILLFSLVSPTNFAKASEHTKIKQEFTTLESELDFSNKEIERAETLIRVIEELDQSLDMENLSNNSESDIEQLSDDAKEFYLLYKSISDENSGHLNEEDVLAVMATFLNDENLEEKVGSSIPNKQLYAYSVIRSKEYKISNQRVKDILSLVGIHGTGWGFAIALAKKFGKSPTWVTLMIAAVPALGAAGLKACNRKGKGVIITRVSIGAIHNFSCRSQ